jgi:hypothetical protein
LFEKRAQWRQIIFSSLQRDRINVVPPQRAGKFCVAPTDKVRKERARFAIGCIDLYLFPGLGVLQCNHADVRQYAFSFVANVDGYEIMSPPAYR